jgi:hypothetical protein
MRTDHQTGNTKRQHRKSRGRVMCSVHTSQADSPSFDSLLPENLVYVIRMHIFLERLFSAFSFLSPAERAKMQGFPLKFVDRMSFVSRER